MATEYFDGLEIKMGSTGNYSGAIVFANGKRLGLLVVGEDGNPSIMIDAGAWRASLRRSRVEMPDCNEG